MSRLNPIDNIFLATHESLRGMGYCGMGCMLMIELEGPLPCDAMAHALRRVGRACPDLFARVTRSGLRRLTRFRSCRSGQDGIVYRHARISSDSDRHERLMPALCDEMDPRQPARVSVIHLSESDTRHWLGLGWPHYLMDLSGALVLLGQVDRALRGEEIQFDRPSQPYEPFAATRGDHWRYAMRAVYRYGRFAKIRQPRLVAAPVDPDRRPGFLVDDVRPEMQARFKETCRQRLAPGPRLYERGMLIALARSYVRLCREAGRPRDRYLFSLVSPLPRDGPRKWPIGNEVVVPWIEFRERDLADWTGADAALRSQFSAPSADDVARVEWFGAVLAAQAPLSWVSWLRRSRAPGAAGSLSAIRFDERFTRLGEATVTNIVPLGTNNAHPGWLLLHSTYRRRASLSLVYYQDFLTSNDARSFLNRIVQAMTE